MVIVGSVAMEVVIPGTNGDILLQLGQVDYAQQNFSAVLVFPFWKGKMLMTFHTYRQGWEFPAGKIEAGETPLECAHRETWEETGALIHSVKAMGGYTVYAKEGPLETAIFTARVRQFDVKPLWSETESVGLFSSLPHNISYPDKVYAMVLEYLKERGLYP